MLVDGRGHRDYEDIALSDFIDRCGDTQVRGFHQLRRADFKRGIVTLLERFDAGLVNIKTDHRPQLSEFDCQWQADVAETDYGDVHFR